MIAAIPSRRQSSEIELSPRRPSKTIRIFSSAENCRRVLRLISLTCLSADPFGPVFVLISYPFKDYDEPKTLVKQNNAVCLKSRDGLHARLLERAPTESDEHLLMMGGSVVHHERVHWQIAHSLSWGIMRSACISLRTTLASLFFRNMDRDRLSLELGRQASGHTPIATGAGYDIRIREDWSSGSHTVAEHAWILTMLPHAFDYGGVSLTRPPDFMLGIMSQYLGGAFDPMAVAFGGADTSFQARVRSFRNPEAVSEWARYAADVVPAMAVEECLAVSAQLIFLEHIETGNDLERRFAERFKNDIVEGVFGADAGHYSICFALAQEATGQDLTDLNLRVLGMICELALDPPLPFLPGGVSGDWTFSRLHPGLRFRALLHAAARSGLLTSTTAVRGSNVQSVAEALLKRAQLTRAKDEDVCTWLATYDEDTTEWPSQELGWQHARTAILCRREVARVPRVLQDLLLSGGSPARHEFYDLPFVLLDGVAQFHDPESDDEARLAGQQVLNGHVSRMTDHLAFRTGVMQPIGLPSVEDDAFAVFAERAHEVLEAALGVEIPSQSTHSKTRQSSEA
jgi:hypothetical protein